MTKEMLHGKLGTNRSVTGEPLILVGDKKRREGGHLLLFQMAVGLGVATLTSITVLAPVSFYGYIESPSSTNGDGNGGRGDAIATIPTALAASVTAIDGEGVVIQDNSVTESTKMTITGYSDSKYDLGLRCFINSLPLYCSDGRVTISGLPSGEYTFAVTEPISGNTTVQVFSWTIS